MRMLGLPFLSPLRELAPLALRLGLGVVFVAHGFSKFSAPAPKASQAC